MLFPTATFAIFFMIVLPLSWALMRTGERWRPFIIGASFVFYAGWDWRFCFLLAFSIVWNQAFALAIHRRSSRRARKQLLVIALVGNLALLGYFKYYGFFVTEAFNLFALAGIDVPLEARSILLPVGISFFTFMAISYVVDVYRGDFAPVGLGTFAAYLSFFPHLVAGPIVRPGELIPQLQAPRDPRYVDTSRAFFLMKVVIANHLAANIVDEVFGAPSQHSSLEVLVGIYAYSVQIYADFFGYTNIAIGIALLLGFTFPQNFDAPYSATSITDFWRRWHMTLSRWLRDYLYIPLGGNRGGTLLTYRNLMLTMLIGGLWHGAGWTFVVWGGIHGSALVVERWWRGRPGFVERPWTRGRRAWHRFVTFQVVCFAWIFFRSDSFADAWDLIVRLFTAWGEPSALVTWVWSPRSPSASARSTSRGTCHSRSWRASPGFRSPRRRSYLRWRCSSFTRWGPKAWHRSSTSSSDGDTRDIDTAPTPPHCGGRTPPALGRVGDRRLGDRTLRRAPPERARAPQVGDDPARGLEARRRARRDRAARERQQRASARPTARGSQGGARTVRRRRGRHRGCRPAAEPHAPGRDAVRAAQASEVHSREEAPPVDRRRLPRRRSRRVGAP